MLGLAIAVSGPGASAGGERAGKLTRPTVMHIDGASVSLPASLDVHHAGDGLAADSAGNLYVGYERSDFSEHVAVLDSQGHFLRDWEVEHGLNSHLPKIAVGGPDGLVYVLPSADPETIKIYKPDGTFVRKFGAGSVSTDSGDIEVDASGNVYVSSAAVTGRPDRFVVRFDPAGNVTRTWVPQPGGRANEAGAIAVAPDGSIFEVGLPTVTLDSTLTHLATDGPVLSTKDLDKALGEGQYKDIDYANGRLYLSGSYATAAGTSHLHALAVLGPDEAVQDQILGQANQVAVSGTHVWLTDRNTTTRARRAAASSFAIGGMDEVPIENSDVNKFAAYNEACNEGGGAGSGREEFGNLPVFIASSPSPGCVVQFYNERSPCTRPQTHGVPTSAYLGGKNRSAQPSGTPGLTSRSRAPQSKQAPSSCAGPAGTPPDRKSKATTSGRATSTDWVIRAARSSMPRRVDLLYRRRSASSSPSPPPAPSALLRLSRRSRRTTARSRGRTAASAGTSSTGTGDSRRARWATTP